MTSIKPDSAGKRRIGPHLPVRSGLVKAADRAHEIGATAMQLFTDNPTAWRRRTELPADLAAFRQRLAEFDIGPLAIHAPYLVNLAGADEKFHQQSIDTMVSELEVGAAYGARFVNVHVGSHRGLGREEGLRQLVDGLARIQGAVGPGGPLLVLENSAGTGDGIGSSLEDLADVVELAARDGLGGLGFCLDTAHLWAAGYCIDGVEGVEQLVRRIDALLGREHVLMLHLNDSRSTCGSRVDRHEHIGAGTIGAAGLRAVLQHPWLSTLPAYLETPGMDDGYDAINLERVRDAAARRGFAGPAGRGFCRPSGAAQSEAPDRVIAGDPLAPSVPLANRHGPHQTALFCCTRRSQIERTKGLYLGFGAHPMMPESIRRTRRTHEYVGQRRARRMSVQNGHAFNEWLRTQLKAKKMSQRQLAQQSGVDHSTISRLVRGDRTPSLGTATKLARGLREVRDESETPHYFGLVATTTSHPTARVEYALRSDDLLTEPQVRQVMEYYLALRMRRLAGARPVQPMPGRTTMPTRMPGRN